MLIGPLVEKDWYQKEEDTKLEDLEATGSHGEAWAELGAASTYGPGVV